LAKLDARDTARTLRLIEFVNRYGEHEEDRAQLAPSDSRRVNRISASLNRILNARLIWLKDKLSAEATKISDYTKQLKALEKQS